ncbi:protein CROWDED NUCLEI 4-like [Raphanus sativus]|nr:protein CROWDED NUCLEI 4-like [Raphanus sativus]
MKTTKNKERIQTENPETDVKKLKQANVELASQAIDIEYLKQKLRKRDKELGAMTCSYHLGERELDQRKFEFSTESKKVSVVVFGFEIKSQLLSQANEIVKSQEDEIHSLQRALKEIEEELEMSITVKRLERIQYIANREKLERKRLVPPYEREAKMQLSKIKFSWEKVSVLKQRVIAQDDELGLQNGDIIMSNSEDANNSSVKRQITRVHLSATMGSSCHKRQKESLLQKIQKKDESRLQRQKLQTEKRVSSSVQKTVDAIKSEAFHHMCDKETELVKPVSGSGNKDDKRSFIHKKNEDVELERKLAQKFKVKNGKLKGVDDGMNGLFEGLPSVLDSMGSELGDSRKKPKRKISEEKHNYEFVSKKPNEKFELGESDEASKEESKRKRDSKHRKKNSSAMTPPTKESEQTLKSHPKRKQTVIKKVESSKSKHGEEMVGKRVKRVNFRWPPDKKFCDGVMKETSYRIGVGGRDAPPDDRSIGSAGVQSRWIGQSGCGGDSMRRWRSRP